MKENIRSRQRLDLEQAAAIVISSIVNDEKIKERDMMARSLVQELDHRILKESCMWLDNHNFKDPTAVQKFDRLRDGVRKILRGRHHVEVGAIDGWSSALKLLLRVRRNNRPGRCLFIPQWVFDAADMEAPETFRQWNSDGWMGSGVYPTLSDEVDNRIIISHNEFNYFQKRLLHYFKFWDPEIRLRKAVDDLENKIRYSTNFIRSQISKTDDTLLVAHYFFALQRRIQLKVVSSTYSCNGFLPKGGASTVFQNTPNVLSTFEEKLSAFSGQTGIPIAGDMSRLMQKCCLLMEEYVTVYSKGDRTKLVYQKSVRGGGGRGSVDTYNLLVDLLRYVREDKRSAGLKAPGPCHKFLAKDIMHYNDSFDDDAFADGKIPGWETWLAERRKELEPFSTRPF